MSRPGQSFARRRVLMVLLLPALLACRIAAQRTGASEAARDWPQFGYDAAGSSASTAVSGIDAANAGSLAHQRVTLPGTVDASAIYLHAAAIGGAAHDAFF